MRVTQGKEQCQQPQTQVLMMRDCIECGKMAHYTISGLVGSSRSMKSASVAD